MSKSSTILIIYTIIVLLLSTYILYATGSIIFNQIRVIGARQGVATDILVSNTTITITGYGFNPGYDNAYEIFTGSEEVAPKLSRSYGFLAEYEFTAYFDNDSCKPLLLDKIILYSNPYTGLNKVSFTRQDSRFMGINMNSVSDLIARWCPYTKKGDIRLILSLRDSYIIVDSTSFPPEKVKLLHSIPDNVLYMKIPFTKVDNHFILEPKQVKYSTPYMINNKHTICEDGKCVYGFNLQGRKVYNELVIKYGMNNKIDSIILLTFILTLLSIPLLASILTNALTSKSKPEIQSIDT